MADQEKEDLNDLDDEDDQDEASAKHVLSDSYYGIPVEEVDPLLFGETFCVISKKFNRHIIYRFSISKSLFLFGPLNRFRKFAICLTTHRWFDHIILLTIVANCVTLAMTTNEFHQDSGFKKIPAYDYYVDQVEYGFLAIYTLEVIFKVVAKGFVLNKYSYLRSRWNLLDFFVVLTSYIAIIIDVINQKEDKDENELEFLRTLRVLRGVKTFSIMPGLKTMINALIGAINHLTEVIAIILVSIMIFALFADDVFMGKLRQKCVVDKAGPQDKNRLLHTPIEDEPDADRDRIWTEWVNDWKNWKPRIFPKEEPSQCGNITGTRPCGIGYTCIGHLGQNPDGGWTNFETFFYSMLATLQLITLDFWERLYDVVLSTCGLMSMIFFLVVIFLGAYYLLNLMLGVVAMSYQSEVDRQDEGPLTASEKLELNRKHSTFSFENMSKLHVYKMTQNRPILKSKINLRPKRLKNTGSGDSLENPDDDNVMNLDATVFDILGMNLRFRSFSSQGGEEEEAGYDEAGPKTSEVDLEGDGGKDKSNNTIGDGSGARLSSFFKKYLGPVVNNTFFEWLIFLCIVLNTVCLATEHHGESATTEYILKIGNNVFIAVFTMEFLLKLLALQGDFFRSGWNIFDMIIVLVSYIDVVLVDSRAGAGLTVLRSLRLLRVFKLAQSWVTMKILLNIIFAASGALGNLTLVILLVVYIFAVMGMLIIGEQYTYPAFDAVKKPLRFPRWHWKNFWHAFLMVFRVLCGEWIEPLNDCFAAQEYYLQQPPAGKNAYLAYFKCFAIFIPVSVVLNLLCLNLFLALLLSSFDTEEINAQREKEKEANKKAEHLKNIVGLLKTKKERGDSDDDESEFADTEEEVGGPPVGLTWATMQVASVAPDSKAKKRFKEAVHKVIVKNRIEKAERAISLMEKHRKKKRQIALNSGMFLSSPAIRRNSLEFDLTPEDSEASEDFTVPRDCIPAHVFTSKYCLCKCTKRRVGPRHNHGCSCCRSNKVEARKNVAAHEHKKRCCNCCCCCKRNRFPVRHAHLQAGVWFKLRWWCAAIVSNPLFEYTILILIFASSITLCFEDIHLENNIQRKVTLCYVNYTFVGIFCLEMMLKIGAIGCWCYFTNFWTILDAFIVCVSLFLLYYDLTLNTCSDSPTARTGAAANLGGLKALRTLRALRPLRAISRWQGMKIVVNALIYAIPSIFNVLLVCLLVWLIFAIMGVQFFKGQFYHCVENNQGDPVYPQAAPNKAVCCAKADTHGYSWVNTISNYDNVFEGYLSLLQVATFEGWMELMQASVDVSGVDKAPVMDNKVAYYLFYVVFIMIGSFFTLRLFVGVVIDNFNMLKNKSEGNMLEVLLTPTQRNYYITLKNLAHKRPKPIRLRPTSPFFGFFYDIAVSRRLEIFIYILIFLNLVNESLEYYGERRPYTDVVFGISVFFTVAYILEAVVKIVGLGTYYFTTPWNVYDFIISLASCLDVLTDGKTISMPLPPPMLRVVRVFRVGRVLRQIKAAQGIRKLIYALLVSLPALLNIGALLGLITFIYAILGMALFGKSPHKWAIDEVFNFETFFNASKMLLRLMTAAGWNEVLDSLTAIEPECGVYRHLQCGMPGENECPVRALVIAYVVSYLILTFLIVISLYIAIIFENYSEASDEEEMGLVEDDLDMFYHMWARFDPHATQFIDFAQLPFLLDNLGEPLRIAKPNILAIVTFNLPIARGNKIHCLDIIHALIRHVLGPVEDSKEFRKLQQQMDRKFRLQFPSRNLLDIVSTTKQWKLENNAARVIQAAWREYKKKRDAAKSSRSLRRSKASSSKHIALSSKSSNK